MPNLPCNSVSTRWPDVVGIVGVGLAEPAGRLVLAVCVVPVPPLVGSGLRITLRRILPVLLAPECGHIEKAPGRSQRLVAAVVDEVGAEHAVAVVDEGVGAVPFVD